MKNFSCFFIRSIFLISVFFLFSCASLVNYTPNWDKAEEQLPADVSDYYDFKLVDTELPDGRKATVYIFNNFDEAYRFQNLQERRYNPKWQELAEQRTAEYKADLAGAKDLIMFNHFYESKIAQVNWMPTGPLSPFYEAVYSIYNKYGLEKTNEIISSNIQSFDYYNAEDLGEIGTYMQTPESGAYAVIEDNSGVYLVTFGPPKAYISNKPISGANISKAEAKSHEGLIVYKCAFIPKSMYKTVQPVKLNPTKITPFNPSAIPDSDRNLAPATASDAPYYYDANIANNLQWLAVKIACKGVYDMAYTGDFRAKNPTDYYKTSFIKSYLAANNGRASKGTTLFEGICFDYADFAYQELSENRAEYPKIANFWMVGTFSDPSDIVAYRIADRGKGDVPTMTINQTPVVVAGHNHILAHDGAKNHAWFWAQATDGTLYWIDPTWTDNTGRPVYGIVRGGKEISLEPNPAYCVR